MKAIADKVRTLDKKEASSISECKTAVFYTDSIVYSGKHPTDEHFMVVSHKHMRMWRCVEVYCWREDVIKREERKGSKSRTVTEYKYTSCWVPAIQFIDSSKFKD